MCSFLTCGTYLLLVSYGSAQKDPNWRNDRSGIVHLFEWKFSDIAAECERFLAKKGYAGVQVSPPSENVITPNRSWWERYQVMSYKIATRSGAESDFLGMSRRCNKVGVRIYADAVLNHMTGNWSNAIGSGGSQADPISKSYPEVPYNSSHFHETCQVTNYSDAENVRNCELTGLKDLDQSNSYVRTKIVNYLNKLISLGVAGFRIDAAKHMWPEDLKYIYSQLNNLNTAFGFPAGRKPYIYQEVIDLGDGAVTTSEYTSMGDVTEFLHGAKIGAVFLGKDKLAYMNNWGKGWGLLESKDALVFIDNHDNQRKHGSAGDTVLTHKTPEVYVRATAFMLAHPYGTPRIMSSYSFNNTDSGPPADGLGNVVSPKPKGACGNGWICEHRWRPIANMIGFRNAVKGAKIHNWWSSGDQQIAFCRGKAGFIAIANRGAINRKLQTCLPAGTYCDVISGELANGACTGKSVTVDNKGFGHISINKSKDAGVLALHVQAKKK